MDGTTLILAAIARRRAEGLSVEWHHDGGVSVRHCVDVADRDAFIARAAARGETTKVLQS